MGGSSGQVTGYRYFTNLLLFIGNPIEKMLGINFDKRGWISPFVDENGNALAQGVINSPNLYGENEGGVAGTVHVQYGRDKQEVLPFYKAYMDSKEIPASAFPYQSYLAFTGLGKVNTGNGWIDGAFGALAGHMNEAFYVGNSGYMKEMLLWPKRTRVRNDGRVQWYKQREDGAVVCEIGSYVQIGDFEDQNVEVVPEVSNYRRYSKFSYKDVDGIYKEQVYEDEGLAIYNSLNQNLFRMPVLLMIAGAGGDTDLVDYNKFFFNVDQKYKFIEIKTSFLVKSEGFNFIATRDGPLDDRWVYSNLEKGEKNDEGYTQYFLNALFKNNTGEMVYETISTGDFEGELSFIGYITGRPVNGAIFMARSESPDINPIHKIREILTDDTAMAKPESDINDLNFMKAADRIYDEGLGVSWAIDEKSCMDAINELCYHIESGIRVNRQTGLYEMVLFRDDWFSEDEIHTISESKIKSMQYEITNADEVINQVNVNYYDRQNIKSSSFSISESGLIQTLGRVNAETVDFPYFMNMRNAEIVANWKLKLLSTGVFKGAFTTGWREARKWNRYDLIHLPWSKRWTGTILVRIMNINLGGPTNNEVSIEFVEVVSATGMMNTTIVSDDAVDTKPKAPKPCNAKVFELPYFEAVQAFGERSVNTELADNAEVGYLCAIAEKPQNNSLNASLHADSGSGFERLATVNYCETAYLDQAIDRLSNSFVVKNVGNLASVRIGSQVFINDETMVYQSYDATTKVLTVKRGALESIPQNHSIDSILYFADDFFAVDQTLYVQGEVVNAKVLTTTPSGILALVDAVNYEVDFNARAIRPYPPANVKINGEYFPESPQQEIFITWVHRNRLQQTGGEIIGFYDVGVTPENGITYELKIDFKKIDGTLISSTTHDLGFVENYTVTSFAAGSEVVRLSLSAVRGGYKSYQSFEFDLNLDFNFSEPYNLNAEYEQ